VDPREQGREQLAGHVIERNAAADATPAGTDSEPRRYLMNLERGSFARTFAYAMAWSAVSRTALAP
jgi:hypothetical protein